MKCTLCQKGFEEKDLHSSHDVPCYLFYWKKSRKEKKSLGDQYPRRWLCKKCHENYEYSLHIRLIKTALEFSKEVPRHGQDS